MAARRPAKTLGQALTELLQAHGLPGVPVHIDGGPHKLRVVYRERDTKGRPLPSTSVITLDLQAP